MLSSTPESATAKVAGAAGVGSRDHVGIEKARRALKTAQDHLRRVQVASFDPADHVEAVTFAFYAYENGIVAVAEARSMAWSKNHYEKAKLAKALFDQEILTTDVEDMLLRLNNLRKDVAYGEPGMNFRRWIWKISRLTWRIFSRKSR